jgi:hypothetical protein
VWPNLGQAFQKATIFLQLLFFSLLLVNIQNTLWCVGHNNVATITEDGLFTNYTATKLGSININQEQKFVFTQNDIFYMRISYSLKVLQQI